MKLSATFLGSYVVKHLEAAYGEHVLVVGADRFTRRQLAAVGCFNFLAARNLTQLLKPFGIRDLYDVYDRLAPGALALPHMGAVSLAVLGAAFEIKRIGGDDPLGNWAKKHAGDVKRAIVTFHTLKVREAAIEAEQRRLRRRRARQQALAAAS